MKNTGILISAIAICCITILEVFAICYDVNGTALAGAVAAIAGLGGYQIARARITK